MQKLFSTRLEEWFGGDKPKTVESLNEAFAEKGFAIIFFLLMFLPALPLPTGGVSHVFELIVMLLGIELLIGRRAIWLPKRWQGRHIVGITNAKAQSKILAVVRFFERIARPRGAWIIESPIFSRIFAFLVVVFTLIAFAPLPFTGLDTLPSMCVVAMSLGYIFEDLVLFTFGVFVGIAGIVVDITVGASAFHLLNKIL